MQSVRLVRLDRFDEVVGMMVVVLRQHVAGHQRSARLHPGRRTPGVDHQRKLRIQLARCQRQGNDVGQVVLNAEVRQARVVAVRLIVVERVPAPRQVARADRVAKEAYADSFRWIEEPLHYLVALDGRELLIDQPRSAVGKRGAAAFHALISYLFVDMNG